MLLLSLIASTTMPAKESGSWIDGVFDWCVGLLLSAAAKLGVSYNAINVWIFCIIWPIFTLFLVGVVLRQRALIRRLMRLARPVSDQALQ